MPRNRKSRRLLRRSKKTARRLRRSRSQHRRRNARTQRGGMPASVMSPEGIPLALQGANTDTTVIKRVGGVPTVMSYNTYVRNFKGEPEDD